MIKEYRIYKNLRSKNTKNLVSILHYYSLLNKNKLIFFSWVERVEASRYLDSGDSGMYLKRPVGWWMGPPNRRLACGAKYAAIGGIALLLLLGLLANFTVIGSDDPFGMVPFSSWIARSASTRWSNRMNPTPFDSPAKFIPRKTIETDIFKMRVAETRSN